MTNQRERGDLKFHTDSDMTATAHTVAKPASITTTHAKHTHRKVFVSSMQLPPPSLFVVILSRTRLSSLYTTTTTTLHTRTPRDLSLSPLRAAAASVRISQQQWRILDKNPSVSVLARRRRPIMKRSSCPRQPDRARARVTQQS